MAREDLPDRDPRVAVVDPDVDCHLIERQDRGVGNRTAGGNEHPDIAQQRNRRDEGGEQHESIEVAHGRRRTTPLSVPTYRWSRSAASAVTFIDGSPASSVVQRCVWR